MAILLIPIFAAVGAALGLLLAMFWVGFDLVLGLSTCTAEARFGLMLIGAAAVEVLGWGAIVYDEVRSGG